MRETRPLFDLLASPSSPTMLPYADRSKGLNTALEWDVRLQPHLWLSGEKGAGKTTMMLTLALGALSTGWELAVCDIHAGWLQHCLSPACLMVTGDVHGAEAIVDALSVETERRYRMCQRRSVWSINEIEESQRPKRILLLVDDAPLQLIPNLVNITTNGRAAGIHMIAASQLNPFTIQGMLSIGLMALQVTPVEITREHKALLPHAGTGRRKVANLWQVTPDDPQTLTLISEHANN